MSEAVIRWASGPVIRARTEALFHSYEALRSVRPVTVVVEDVLSRQPPPDLELEMRRALGVEIA